MKKNVLLMVPMLDQGGLERMCALTAVLLKDACQVTVVVFNGENRIYELQGVELIDLHLGSKNGKIKKVYNVLQRVRKIKRIKKEKKIDVTYSFGNTANLVNVLAKADDQVYIGIRGYGALAETNVMDYTCKHADKVICCTKVMAEDVRNRFLVKEVVTLYNPCDIQNIKQAAKEPMAEQHAFFDGTEQIIATMGRMHDVKGFWHLIKIFYLVHQEQPDTKLLFIGDKDSSEYQEMVSRLGLKDSVLFLGVQKNPFCYLKHASAYMLTSISEGFPNALIEAMALNIPVLATNCKTGPAEILLDHYKTVMDVNKAYDGEYGILLPVMGTEKNVDITVFEEAERIAAKALGQLLLSKEKQEQYQRAGEKRAESFSLEQYKEALIMEISGGTSSNVKEHK